MAGGVTGQNGFALKCDNLVIEAVGGETASKQDMDKSAYVCHNTPHHKARLKKECDGMRFLIEWNNDDIGVTQVEISDHIFSSLDKFIVDTSIKFSLQTKPGEKIYASMVGVDERMSERAATIDVKADVVAWMRTTSIS
ncbi:hypothetical protein Tco_1549151 [Tanacetum coccineum]